MNGEALKVVVGCNYHTTWQSHKAMRFVLAEVKGERARLVTRTTKREFWTDIKDLIFIPSKHNYKKAIKLQHDKKIHNPQ
jgi:hypothetical protein